MPLESIPIKLLGQSGCRIDFAGVTVYVDPYLSNSVQLFDSVELERQIPIPVLPDQVNDAKIVLITHAHLDHCDPYTLPQLALASPQALFVGPKVVSVKLKEWGISPSRILPALEEWTQLASDLRVLTIPAAHPEIERDELGNLICVGYLLDFAGRLIYLAGDTFVRQEIIDNLVQQGPVHTAFLPVNEHNFFRSRCGIIGNMTVREAFQFAEEIGAKQVVPVHWDMFANNSTSEDEIRLIHKNMGIESTLLIRPTRLFLSNTRISIVIRTLNEALHLDELLVSIKAQQTHGWDIEIILVDSGSSDGTLKIAKQHGCKILHIARKDFSFGRSLNMGCSEAMGDILVIISGHCVPNDQNWLENLCQPIFRGLADYTYGRQVGGSKSFFSEQQIFGKYFPEQSSIPQEGFFCNNANAAILKSAWDRYRFDEDVTGLEDMELAKRLVQDGRYVAYVAEATVSHHHNETWSQIRHRFEREAIALQKIMPHIHVNLFDSIRYIFTSILHDIKKIYLLNLTPSLLVSVVLYRWNQYIGSRKGNLQHRKLSHEEKDKYFYPF
jgi:rhamnosyltransferase